MLHHVTSFGVRVQPSSFRRSVVLATSRVQLLLWITCGGEIWCGWEATTWRTHFFQSRPVGRRGCHAERQRQTINVGSATQGVTCRAEREIAYGGGDQAQWLWPTFQSGTVCKSPCSINNLVNELISFPPSVYKVKVLPSPTLT